MIEINNLTKSRIEKSFLKGVAEKVFQGEKKGLNLSIVFVGPSRIRELNRTYRKKDKATDVLSFLYDDLGEVIICLSKVRKNAGDYGLSAKEELGRILIHGILHLFGYDHRRKDETKKMQLKENYYFSKL